MQILQEKQLLYPTAARIDCFVYGDTGHGRLLFRGVPSPTTGVSQAGCLGAGDTQTPFVEAGVANHRHSRTGEKLASWCLF